MSTTIQLFNDLRTLADQFNHKYSDTLYFNVLPCDKLPAKIRKANRVFFCIINNQTHKEPGEHWLAIYIESNPQTKFRTAFYYDAYAEPVTFQHKKIKNFLITNADRVIFNKKRIQSDFSMNCGKFCVMFLHHKLNGGSLTSFNKQFTSKNLHMNDKRVEKMYKSAFKKKAESKTKNAGQFGGNVITKFKNYNQTCCARLR